jgi:hypothetical protein
MLYLTQVRVGLTLTESAEKEGVGYPGTDNGYDLMGGGAESASHTPSDQIPLHSCPFLSLQ